MNCINHDQINAAMQQGYEYAMNNDSISACNEWRDVWNAIVSSMDSGNYATVEDFDEVFGGLQSVFNWASDYELELINAIEEDASFAKERLSFCKEYFDRASDKGAQNSLNMRAAIADSYIRLGMTENGEKLFIDLITEYPTWGWGWIKWSDAYSFNAVDRDYGKSLEILKEALEVDGIDEIYVIKERLQEIYEDCGMHEEANAIVFDVRDYGVPLSEISSITDTLKNKLEAFINDLFGS